MTRISTAFLSLPALALSTAASAASLDIDFPGYELRSGGTFSGETRIVHFEVTEAIELTSLAARIGTAAAGTNGTTTTTTPVSTWSVTISDAAASLGAVVATADAGITFSSLTQESAIYETSVSITLDPGFYFLGLRIDTPIIYYHYLEYTVPLPLVSADGAIRVLDGVLIQSGNPTDVKASNDSLPAYNIGYEVQVSTVPLPAAALLLFCGCGALAAVGRRRRAD